MSTDVSEMFSKQKALTSDFLSHKLLILNESTLKKGTTNSGRCRPSDGRGLGKDGYALVGRGFLGGV